MPRRKDAIQINILSNKEGVDLIDFCRKRFAMSRSEFCRRAIAWALQNGFLEALR